MEGYFGDPTAEQIQHNDASQMWKHFRGNVGGSNKNNYKILCSFVPCLLNQDVFLYPLTTHEQQ